MYLDKVIPEVNPVRKTDNMFMEDRLSKHKAGIPIGADVPDEIVTRVARQQVAA